MAFEIRLTNEAVQDLKDLPPFHRAAVKHALERHLRHEPRLVSKSRIKRLRGNMRPQYRLRVGDNRVFYRVEGGTVIVLGIVAKSEQDRWLSHQSANER